MAITREIIGSKIWASDAPDPADRTEPTSGEIVAGWPEGKPPRQWFNWLDYVQHNNLAFFEQAGIFVWSEYITYEKYGLCRADDGVIYISIVNDNVENDPSGGTDLINWQNFGDWLSENSLNTVSSYLKLIDSDSAEAIAGEVTLSPGIYDIHCIGAGGGGGGSATSIYDGHGGGGGAAVMSRVTLSAETTLSLSLGAGGAGGALNSGGGDGGTTTISTLVAVGGTGGDIPESETPVNGGEGGDADDCTGDIAWSGASGALAYARINSTVGIASYGGASGGPMGGSFGGSGNYVSNLAGTESQYGAGGRGGNAGGSGADGADGAIFIVGVK